MRVMMSMVICGLLLAAQASASRFDFSTGRLDLSDAAVAWSMDAVSDLPAGMTLKVLNSDFEEVEGRTYSDMFELDRGGLEGRGRMRLGGEALVALLDPGDALDGLRGHRIELRLWQRPLGSRAEVALSWSVGGSGLPMFDDSGFLLGSVQLRPTGRVTDDGWEEWSSGPVDYAAGGLAGVSAISFYDSQLLDYYHSWFSSFDDSFAVLVDALEVLDLGPAAVAPIACTLVDEAETCGAQGLCLFGRCVDAAVVEGAMPLPAQLSDYLERRLVEFGMVEGGRLPQQRMHGLQQALRRQAASPTPASFWSDFRQAVEALGDGHASAPTLAFPNTSNLGICVHLGVADLLPQGGETPLLFSAGAANPVADQLEPGDALITIDGLPAMTWAGMAGRLLSHGGDDRGRDVVVAPQLLDAAVLTGATLEFARCQIAGGARPCTSAEVEVTRIDLGVLLGEPIWSGFVPDWAQDSADCDYRFGREVEAEDVREYTFAGSADRDGVRTLIINGVPGSYGRNGGTWISGVREALDPGPERLILDHRMGSGGSIEGTDFIAALLLEPGEFWAMDLIPATERPVDDALVWAFRGCKPADMSGSDCGFYMQWFLGHEHSVGSNPGAAGSSRLAVLMARDVSGNDFLSRLITYRAAPTRFFGAGSTYGAFGSVMSLPSLIGEMSGGSFQLSDTLFAQAPDSVSHAFSTGVGVVPDQRVLQRQSDAVQGVDTAVEAARAWLLEGE